jgi:hypothetical protein
MSPNNAAQLANVRAAAALPGARFITVHGPAGSVTIHPNDIVGKSDDELLAFIADRLTAPHGRDEFDRSVATQRNYRWPSAKFRRRQRWR